MNHQVHSKLDEERKSYELRILELQGVLQKHEYEVTKPRIVIIPSI